MRRKLISLLLTDGELDLARKILVGAFLLIDGRLHKATLEMMQEESAISCVVNTLWKRQSESTRLRRIFLELMYEMCKVQKLRLVDLKMISSEFVTHLFTAIENRDDYDHDPYGYAIIKVLLALNEQYMIAFYDQSVKQDNPELSDAVEPSFLNGSNIPQSPEESEFSSPSHFMLPNIVLETLVSQRDHFRLFGENIVFLLNRSPDDCIQLMVLKFLYLIFTTPETYNYLYLNDLKVIVDVFIRELCNLSNEEERLRHTYLRVLYPLLENTELGQEPYKRAEIVSMLEDMSENACKSVLDISETTQRLAYRCLLVEWLDHCTSQSSQNSSLLHLDRTQSGDSQGSVNAKDDLQLHFRENALSSSLPNIAPTSLSEENTGKDSLSPNSTGSPISPISSNSFTTILSLSDPSPDTCDNTAYSKPPPPPPSRRPKLHEQASKKRAHRPPPPVVPAHRLPPPRPLPRKKPSLLGMSIRNTSVMELATYSLNNDNVIRRASVPCTPEYNEKELPPLPNCAPAPPRPRINQSHSLY